ncbi:hypothetical protein D3C76_1778590 [compost metagenome]
MGDMLAIVQNQDIPGCLRQPGDAHGMHSGAVLVVLAMQRKQWTINGVDCAFNRPVAENFRQPGVGPG